MLPDPKEQVLSPTSCAGPLSVWTQHSASGVWGQGMGQLPTLGMTTVPFLKRYFHPGFANIIVVVAVLYNLMSF